MDFVQKEELIINQIYEEEKAKQKGSPFLSDIALREKAKLEVRTLEEALSEKIRSGYLILVKLYQEKKTDMNESLIIPFLEPGFFNEEFIAQKDTLKVENYEESLAEYFDIDDSAFEQAYKLILPLFEKEQYQEAESVLFFLNFICPGSPDFLSAMGHVAYQLNQLDYAASLFLMAFSIDDTDNELLSYAAYCFNEMGDAESAQECLAFAGDHIPASVS